MIAFATLTLSRDQTRKLIDYCTRLDYEYELWAGDVKDQSRSGDIFKRRARNGSHCTALDLALKQTRRGDIAIDRALLGGIMTDLTWLVEEWYSAIGDMDSRDAASYRPRIPALERFIKMLEDKTAV
jgi:hypothetical protein